MGGAEEQGFRSPVDPVPMSELPAAYFTTWEIPILEFYSRTMPQLVVVIVQMMVDLEALLHPHMVSIVLGEFQIPDVSLSF